MLGRRGLSGVPERGPIVDGRAMARPLGMLFLGAGVLGLLWIVLPRPSGSTPAAVGAVAAVALIGGALLVSGKADDRPPRTFEIALALSTILISVALFFSGRAGSGFGYFYVWTTPYAYWFFSYRRALFQTALAAAGYTAASILVRVAHPSFPGSFSNSISRILLAVGTIAIVGELVRLVSDRLRDSHLRFEQVVSEAPIAMARLRLDGSFIEVNPAFCTMLGQPASEILVGSLVDSVPEDERELFELRQRELLAGGTGSYQADTTFERPDGSRVAGIITATLIRDVNRLPREIFLQVVDVTARKEAEEDLRAFFALAENAGDFIGIAELDGRFRYVNEAGRTLIGAADLEEARSLAIIDCLSGRGRELFVRSENPALLERGSWRGETQLRNVKTGADVEVELNSFVIRHPATGEPTAIGIVQRDISERKRAWHALERGHEERRRLLAGLVRAQEEERERIAADVHDDSIQVMTGAAIRLQLLADQLEDPVQQQLLTRLDESVRTSIGSLRQLLFELRPPALDAHGLGAALETYLSHTLEPEGLEYTLRDELSEEPPSDARTVLYRVAQEALANVRKHARASHVDVVIENNTGGWRVRVEDDGIGFEVEEEPVERPGHLGLIGMRERLETSGGRMSLVSSPGAGTTVELWLPAEHEAFIRAG
jgi:PAS domain S-box-containing protein